MRYIFFIFISLISFELFSQSNLALNEWKSYLPYQNVRKVVETDDRVLFATEWSILVHNPSDNSFDFLSKVDGLSDIGIAQITYDRFNDQLIIAYQNSNLDVVTEQDIINKSDIRDNGSLTGDRSINHLHVANENFLYLSTAFGILEQNLKNLEFGPTIFTNSIVYQMASNESILYAATEDGLYYVDTETSVNIGDFSTWSMYSEESGLPLVYESQFVAFANETLYCIVDGILKRLVQDQFVDVFQIPDGYVARYLKESGGLLSLGIFDEEFSSEALFFDESHQLIKEFTNCNNRITDVHIARDGRIWLADEWDGIRYAENLNSEGCQRIFLDTPNSHTVSEIALDGNDIYIATGGVSDSYTSLNSRDGFYVYRDNEWTIYNENSYSPIVENNLLNFYRVLKHPSENKIVLGTYYGGIMIVDLETNEFEVFNKDNSALQGTVGNENRTRIGGMVYDDEGNLWVSNFGAPEPLVVFLNGGGSLSFDVAGSNNLAQIDIDPSGLIWAVVAGNPGSLLIYDFGGTPQDPSDDDDRPVNLGVIINSVEVDNDGDVWVGTVEGPFIFECGPSAVENSCEPTQRKVLQDSIPAILLQTENIRSIETDGANRKWFGTRNGVFVQSPDGEEQIAFFDEDNSPLFDNSVNTLRFNPETGEMFLGTDKGIQSIRTETTGGNARHSQNIYAFPNPVRPDYNGPIAIKGLANDAEVKITDINGKLIYETTALGGQAVWDGRDYNGRRAASGVYLVFSSSTETFDMPDSYVTKILMVN